MLPQPTSEKQHTIEHKQLERLQGIEELRQQAIERNQPLTFADIQKEFKLPDLGRLLDQRNTLAEELERNFTLVQAADNETNDESEGVEEETSAQLFESLEPNEKVDRKKIQSLLIRAIDLRAQLLQIKVILDEVSNLALADTTDTEMNWLSAQLRSDIETVSISSEESINWVRTLKEARDAAGSLESKIKSKEYADAVRQLEELRQETFLVLQEEAKGIQERVNSRLQSKNMASLQAVLRTFPTDSPQEQQQVEYGKKFWAVPDRKTAATKKEFTETYQLATDLKEFVSAVERLQGNIRDLMNNIEQGKTSSNEPLKKSCRELSQTKKTVLEEIIKELQSLLQENKPLILLGLAGKILKYEPNKKDPENKDLWRFGRGKGSHLSWIEGELCPVFYVDTLAEKGSGGRQYPVRYLMRSTTKKPVHALVGDESPSQAARRYGGRLETTKEKKGREKGREKGKTTNPQSRQKKGGKRKK